MIVFLKYKNNWIDITNDIDGKIMLDIRIDKILNGGSFILNTAKITENIPPFTKLDIVINNAVKYTFFASSTAKKIGKTNFFFHEVTLYDSLKWFQTLLINNKSFSIVEDVKDPFYYNYNSTYDKINIMRSLLEDKYNVHINLSSAISDMKEEREFSFSSGTTFFDFLIEIMQCEKKFPKTHFLDTYVNGTIQEDNIYLDVIDYSEKTTINNISNISEIAYSQNVDNFSKTIETELNQVVERNTLSNWTGVLHTDKSYIDRDTACIILPNNVESIKKFEIYIDTNTTYYFNGPFIKIKVLGSINSWISSNTTSGVSNYTYLDIKYKLDTYETVELATKIKNGIESAYLALTGNSINDTTVLSVVAQKNEYVYLTLETDFNVSSGQWLDLTPFLLNETQWNLLESDVQPYYAYMKNGENYIKGFYNYFHDNLAEKAIFGENGPFLESINTQPNLNNDYVISQFESYDFTFENDNVDYLASGYVNSGTSTLIDFYDRLYRVKYYTQSEFATTKTKNSELLNNSTFDITSLSFNAGGNTVNFDNLIDSLNTSVNLSGNQEISIESQTDENLDLGVLTNYGYIVEKQITLAVNDDLLNIVYKTNKYYEQVAASIGLNSQYEATNIPNNNVINRFINFETTLTQSQYNNDVYLDVNGKYFKVCNKLSANNEFYLTCSMVDNYTFDFQKIASSTTGFFQNKAISFDNEEQAFFLSINLCAFVDTTNVNYYNQLPYKNLNWNFNWTKEINNDKIIAKDPREKLIFIFKINIVG